MKRFPFEPALVLAPMEGVTSAPIRKLIASYGPVGLVCTEFVRIAGDKVSPDKLARHVEKAPGVPLSVQVMGNDVELMAEAGAAMAQAGADVVDVNLGCPSRAAARKGVGAALLCDRVRLSALLTSMRAAVPGLFSAKLRAGFERSDDALANARLVEQSGADFLTVHPRRRIDFYQGVADWRIIALLRRELSLPVIGNGDVWYAADALRMVEQTGCSAVMIGRPAMRNPWIFRQVAELRQGKTPFAPSGADVACHVDRIVAALAENWRGSRQHMLGPLKEQVVFLCRALPQALSVRTRLLRLQTVESLLEGVHELFEPLAPEQLDLDAQGRHALERCGDAGLELAS